MKKNISSLIWGGLFIFVGIFIAGRAFHLFTFNIFFPGFWTLFIIVPCFVGLFSREGEKGGYIVGLAIGFFLLLLAQRIIRWNMFAPLCIAAILVYIGIKMIFTKDSHNDTKNETYQSYTYENNTYEDRSYQDTMYENESYDNNDENHNPGYMYEDSDFVKAPVNDSRDEYEGNQTTRNYESMGGSYNRNQTSGYQSSSDFGANTNKAYNGEYGSNGTYNRYSNGPYRNPRSLCTAVFSGKQIRFDQEVFEGAMLSAVLGGIEMDLRNAIIRENVVIEARAVLGGIDIRVPDDVKVVINCTPILGGVDDRTKTPYGMNEYTKTIFINATCVLGGIDVK